MFFLFAFKVNSQVSACPNWSKTDCNGKAHTLYGHLDSNQVVALIFGMGCSSCTDAISFFTSLKTKYTSSHPGKFKVFYMDFFAGNTCANNVTPIVGTALDAGFDNCSAELAAYTSASPMTYVVVVGGSSHSILYSIKKYIFDYSDSTNIVTAIDNYFVPAGIKKNDESSFKSTFYPNPAHDKTTVKSKDEEIQSYSIIDSKGMKVSELKNISRREISISLEGFCNGEYYVELTYKSGRRETQKITTQN